MVAGVRGVQLQEVAGAGALGTVYRAQFDQGSNEARTRAVKILHPRLEHLDRVAGRLEDEARLLGSVHHRAIVQVEGLTQLQGQWAVVMEWVDGLSLGQALEQGALAPGVALEITAEIASALHAAFNAEGPDGSKMLLLHRDLKPSNVLVTPSGEVKVLDFGLAPADLTGKAPSAGRRSFGTPAHTAPERLGKRHCGPQADIYALGVLLYEMLTGKNFGQTSAVQDRHEALVQEALIRLGALGDPAPALSALLYEMLTWTPENRPTAQEVERRCMRLRASLEGMSLRHWAERVVVPALEERAARPLRAEPIKADVLSTVLVDRKDPERQTERPPPPPPPKPADIPEPDEAPAPTEARRSGWAAVALASLGGTAVGLVVLAGIWLAGFAPHAPPPTDVASTAPPAQVQPTPPPAPTTTPTVAPAPPPTPAPVVSLAPQPTPAPPVAAPPAPVAPQHAQPKEAASEPTKTAVAAPAHATEKPPATEGASVTTPATHARTTHAAAEPLVRVTLAAGSSALRLSGGGHTYEIGSSGEVAAGVTYAAQIRASPDEPWQSVGAVSITAADASSGVTLQCHAAQGRCRRL